MSTRHLYMGVPPQVGGGGGENSIIISRATWGPGKLFYAMFLLKIYILLFLKAKQ